MGSVVWAALLLSFAAAVFAEAACPPSICNFVDRTPITKPAKLVARLDLFRNPALPYDVFGTFTDVFLSVNISDSNLYRVYQGSNCSSVMDEYQQDNRLFGLLKSVNSWRANHLYPFNETVVGIDTKEPYSVGIVTWKVNYIRVALFLGGILLFLFAGSLVRNVVFYYTSGCSLGLLASVLLVAFLVFRMAPKKTIGIPIIVGGWSVSLYMLHFAWNNLSHIMMQYQKYVILYFAAALLISFAVCYKRGPPTDARSHDIAQWMMQLIALVLIYVAPQVTEVSLAVIAVLVAHQLTRSWLWGLIGSIFGVFSWIFGKFYTPKRRLLTRDEYERQTKQTTAEELEKLRSFCRSPQANAWKITHSMKNPKRLARFIDGSEEHISDDEAVEHDLASEFLERDSSEEVTIEDDEEEMEHEIIIRRKSRNGHSTPLNRSMASTSFVAPRGMTADEIIQRISASAMPAQQKKSRLGQRGRHSLAGNMAPILPPHSRRSSSSRSTLPATSSTSVTRSHAGRNPPKPTKSRRSVMQDYLSSDSEEKYEDDLIAEGGDFDFERD